MVVHALISIVSGVQVTEDTLGGQTATTSVGTGHQACCHKISTVLQAFNSLGKLKLRNAAGPDTKALYSVLGLTLRVVVHTTPCGDAVAADLISSGHLSAVDVHVPAVRRGSNTACLTTALGRQVLKAHVCAKSGQVACTFLESSDSILQGVNAGLNHGSGCGALERVLRVLDGVGQGWGRVFNEFCLFYGFEEFLFLAQHLSNHSWVVLPVVLSVFVDGFGSIEAGIEAFCIV